MALTRAQVESSLIAMSGGPEGLMKAAGFSLLANGANPDLNQPLWMSLRTLGYPVASPAAVADSDLLALPTHRQPYFVALADVLNSENLLAILSLQVDEEHAPDTLFLGQIAKNLQKSIERKWKLIEDRYNGGQAIPVSGLMACGPNPPDALCVRVPAYNCRPSKCCP